MTSAFPSGSGVSGVIQGNVGMAPLRRLDDYLDIA
jgi:hypothetical protein